MTKLLESKYFRLEQPAEGVYAAIVQDGTGAMANAAFIDLGDWNVIPLSSRVKLLDLKTVYMKMAKTIDHIRVSRFQ
jgi:hypothetical protein